MAVKGSASKEAIFNKLQEMFEGSFMADAKTLRIPMVEDGQVVEIKVTLTAAKDVLGSAPVTASAPTASTTSGALTDEERESVEQMIEKLKIRVL